MGSAKKTTKLYLQLIAPASTLVFLDKPTKKVKTCLRNSSFLLETYMLMRYVLVSKRDPIVKEVENFDKVFDNRIRTRALEVTGLSNIPVPI